MQGFLGFGGTFRADLNLTVQLAMGAALLAGMYLARKKRFRAHQICQTTVVLLNLLMIFLVMAPSFHLQVEPQIPEGLKEIYYLTAFVHAGLGTVAELLGIYVILVAGTNLVPQKFQFRKWRVWMRATLAIWWLVILLGVGTYVVWYAAPRGKAAPPAAQQAAEKPAVKISNFQFEPKEITVTAGTTVEWENEGGRHNVTADNGSFKSPTLVGGDKFEHKFVKPGEYPYHCTFHGDKGGKEMSGVVKVTK